MKVELLNIVLVIITIIGFITIGYLVYHIIVLAQNYTVSKSFHYNEESMNTRARAAASFSFRPDVPDENGNYTNRPDVPDENGNYTNRPDVPDENGNYTNRPDVLDESGDTNLISPNTTGMPAFARLRFITCAGGPSKREEFLISRDTSLGRSAKTDIFVDDRAVSRYHIIIHAEKDKIWIVDQNSTNGTRLGGQRLKPMHPALINFGAVITVGKTTFLIEKL